MSDFLYSTRPLPAGVLAASLRGCLAPVAAEPEEWTGPWGTLAATRRPGGASPVHADGSGWTAVAGEPIVSLPGRPPGPVNREGRRPALHALLLSGEAAAERLDGMWAAVGGAGGGAARVTTDRFGFIPVYQAAHAAGGGLVVGTHVDAVARAAGSGGDWDPVSLADLLLHMICTFPFTPYRGVLQLSPGTERELASGAERVHWRPEETERFRRIGEAGEALREALRTDLAGACEGVEEAGILLSGGEDSRALLGAMPASVRVTAFTYSGAANRELRAARRAAAAYGAALVAGIRDADHYVRGMPAVAAMVGSMHLFMDVHGYGMHRRLGIDRLPVVVGGLSADSLLKAAYAPAGSRPPPLPAAPGVRPELLAAVAERRAAFLAWLREIRPATAPEWSVLWPFSQRKHGGNVHGNRRLFPVHEAYHCNGALEVAAAAPVEWKRDRRLFVEAVRPFLRRSWWVPHARSRFPYFAAGPNRVLGALLRGGRALRDLPTGDVLRRQGGWPKWSEVSGSAAAAEAWERYPGEESALRELFPDACPPVEMMRSLRGVQPLRQLMALQLSYLSGHPGGSRA